MSQEETLRFGIDSAGLTDNLVHITAELCGEAAGLLRGEDKAGDRQVWRQGQDHQRREEQGRHLRRRPQGHRGHLDHLRIILTYVGRRRVGVIFYLPRYSAAIQTDFTNRPNMFPKRFLKRMPKNPTIIAQKWPQSAKKDS